MPWPEFCNLLGSLMANTPLGQVVSIRSETDRETIKNFTTSQKRIYNEWKNKTAQSKLVDMKTYDQQMKALEQELEKRFGKGGE